ncbi:hypothetical protein GCM10025880_35630 [Methylorubrum aminovorans]|nr:hypothetical protein GCM10025880_35630 [Methylorubrum aminovorans]
MFLRVMTVALEEAGQAADPDPQASFGQTVTQLMQEKLGLRFGGLPDQVGLRLDCMRALIAAHRLGLRPPLLNEGSVPAHGAGWADLETSCRFPARRARLDRSHHTLAQISR